MKHELSINTVDTLFRRGIVIITLLFGILEFTLFKDNIWVRALFVVLMAGIVGYFTNFLAIKMLFQPKQGKVLGWEGLVPKNKKKIARSLGNSIQNQLLAPEIILAYIYERKLIETGTLKLANWIDQIFQDEKVRNAVTAKIISVLKEKGPEIVSAVFDVSEETSLLAVSGPKAEAIVQKLTNHDLSEMGTYFCFKDTFNGAEKSLIATTGYTGERTFEIFIYNKYAEKMWNDLMEVGEEFGLIPTGLGARDTLRLEMGYMLYGNDINDETSPLEAGLGWITKLNKGPFNGSDILAKQKSEGINKKLVGLEIVERGIPRSGYEIAHEGKVVGTVTSGSMSPLLNKGIGMGYVPSELSAIGTELDIMIRNKPVRAEVVKRPFITK